MENHYVSPGMIDFNIRRNRDWETVEELTKTAVSGGVTFCVEERTLEESDLQESGQLYCDIAYTAVVEPSVVLSLRKEDYEDALALKGYLAPPNDRIGALHDLRQWFQVANRFGLPLLLDPSVVDNKVLFTASPCRLVTLEQRKNTEDFTDVFGGAFRADEDSMDSEEEEEVQELRPDRIRKPRDESDETSRKLSLMHTGETAARRDEPRQQTLGHIPDFKTSSYKNIHSALEDKINESAEKRESLVTAEMMSYKGVGRTMYRHFPRSQSDICKPTESGLKSAHIQVHLDHSPNSDLPISEPKKRRPAPLTIAPARPPTDSTSIYLQQLAYYPDSMETKGVKRILKVLKSTPCKVHITNLSSATAIATIRKAKEERVEITCETCPHFLYFTDQSVDNGDTRLKNFPPIRNKSNCNFLWELVTMNSVDAVCSQHIPIPKMYKFKPNFRKALSGINGIGFTLQVLWTLLKRPFADLASFEHYLVRLARWTSNNPAKILQLTNRGSIEKGFTADLVIWNPLEEVTIRDSYSSHRDQSPYFGTPLYGKIEKVLVRGKLAYADGVLYPVGRPIRRQDA